MTYLRINLRTIGLSVNLGPVVLKHLKVIVRFYLKIGLKTVLNVL